MCAASRPRSRRAPCGPRRARAVAHGLSGVRGPACAARCARPRRERAATARARGQWRPALRRRASGYCRRASGKYRRATHDWLDCAGQRRPVGRPWAGPGRRHQPGVAGEAVVGELAVLGAQRLGVRFELGHGEPDLDVAQLELENQQLDLDQRGPGPPLQRISSAARSTRTGTAVARACFRSCAW